MLREIYWQAEKRLPAYFASIPPSKTKLVPEVGQPNVAVEDISEDSPHLS